jgi:hypothetical protein
MILHSSDEGTGVEAELAESPISWAMLRTSLFRVVQQLEVEFRRTPYTHPDFFVHRQIS